MISAAQRRFQFSLRTLMVITAVIAVSVGSYAERIKSNRRAVDALRSRGVLLGCRYFDPIGPDFIYTWDARGAIPNGWFSPWFELRCCTEYVDDAFFADVDVQLSDIEHLRNVRIRYAVRFINAQLTEGTIAALCRGLKCSCLSFEGTRLTDEDFASLVAAPSLQRLYIDRAHISEEVIALFRRQRPELKLVVFESGEAVPSEPDR
jgi:hypothetical protein